MGKCLFQVPVPIHVPSLAFLTMSHIPDLHWLTFFMSYMFPRAPITKYQKLDA